MVADLDREIANEEKRAGISDPHHFAYPTYARAAIARRDNLKSSIAELAIQIEEAKAAQETRRPSCRNTNRSTAAKRPPSAPPKRSRGSERAATPFAHLRAEASPPVAARRLR